MIWHFPCRCWRNFFWIYQDGSHDIDPCSFRGISIEQYQYQICWDQDNVALTVSQISLTVWMHGWANIISQSWMPKDASHNSITMNNDRRNSNIKSSNSPPDDWPSLTLLGDLVDWKLRSKINPHMSWYSPLFKSKCRNFREWLFVQLLTLSRRTTNWKASQHRCARLNIYSRWQYR